jgi:hypothetical protein
MGKSHSYRLLNAAQILETTLSQSPIGDSVKVTSQVPESEAIARELVPLLGNPQAIDEAWNEAVETAGGVPTAAVVREIVARKLTEPQPDRTKPLHDLEGIDPDLFKLATRAIGHAGTFSAFVAIADPQAVWAGLKEYEKPAFIANCLSILEWIDFINHLKETDTDLRTLPFSIVREIRRVSIRCILMACGK